MVYSTLTSKGQTTLPTEVRKLLRLKPGDRIVYDMTPNGIVLRAPRGLSALHGALASGGVRKGSFQKARSVAQRAVARQAAKSGLE